MSDTDSNAAAQPREVELKLDCAGPDLTALASHPRLKDASATEPVSLVTTYYDTPDRALRKNGLTLRVRAKGDRHIQTVKAGSGGVGLFDRAEWESEIAGEAPEPAAWADTAAGPVLREADAPLERLFATVVQRREVAVAQGESRVLVTLDEGRVETDSGVAPLCEVELELQSGDPADLFALARELAEAVPLRLGVKAKSAVGYALLDGIEPGVVKAEPVELPEGASAGEVFRRVARACLRHMRLNETAFLEGGRPAPRAPPPRRPPPPPPPPPPPCDAAGPPPGRAPARPRRSTRSASPCAACARRCRCSGPCWRAIPGRPASTTRSSASPSPSATPATSTCS
ncbi:CYTH domain-containing protein [Methylobacterium sp. A52T]